MEIIISFVTVLSALAILVLLYANRIEARNMDIIHISYTTEKNVPQFTLLHISDCHLYRGMDTVRLENMKKAIGIALGTGKPDLVCITGDMVDNNAGIELIDSLLEQVIAPCGVYAVLGNHDYQEYNFLHMFTPLFDWMDRVDISQEKLRKAFADKGVRVLMDESLEIRIRNGTIILTGVDTMTWKNNGKVPVMKHDKERFHLLLSHYPDIVKTVKGNTDLLLSGHTHGGQITLFGRPLITRSTIGPDKAGGVSTHDGTVLSISRGMGVSRYIPFRIFSRPDIALITVKGANYDK